MTRSLKPGDRVECSVRGVTFKATLTIWYPEGWGIEPDEPRRITYRVVSPRRIVKKLDSGATE